MSSACTCHLDEGTCWWCFYTSETEKTKRYEEALYALLKLACDADNDTFIEIIVDALNGFELMDIYKNDAIEGKMIFDTLNILREVDH